MPSVAPFRSRLLLSTLRQIIRVFVLALPALGAVNVYAQNNTLVDEGSKPIYGAGHNFISGLSETVGLSGGTVNIHINIPTPKSRGMTLPFAFTYNSGSVHRFASPGAGCGAIDGVVSCYASMPLLFTDKSNQGGGWGDTLPYATASVWNVISAPPGGPGGNNTGCGFSSSYNFYDMFGGRHPLGIAAISAASGSACQEIRYDPNNPGGYYYASSAGTGDDEISATAEANCNGAQSENPDCGSGPSFKVTDLNSNLYTFTSGQAGTTTNNTYTTPAFTAFVYPSQIEDRNGNITTFTFNPSTNVGGLPVVDSSGRPIIAVSNASGALNADPVLGTPAGEGSQATAPVPLTYTIGGLAYKLAFTSVNASYTAQSQNLSNSGAATCNAKFTVSSEKYYAVSSISLPNGTSYQFTYDSTYGLVNSIVYPSGAWVKYTYKLSDTMNEATTFAAVLVNGQQNGSNAPAVSSYPGDCNYIYQTPVIATRTVGYSGGATGAQSGSGAAQTQTFSYVTNWAPSSINWLSKTTTVVTTDNVTGRQSKAIYTYGAVGQPTQINEWNQPLPELPVETSVVIYDLGTGSSSTVLSTVTKTWADQYNLTSQETTLAGGKSSWDSYCYTSGAISTGSTLVGEKDEYDFGTSGPSLNAPTVSATSPYAATTANCGSPAPTRKTTFTYFNSTSPCSAIVYDASGNRTAETDDYLDGGSTTCVSGAVATGNGVSVIGSTHDETGYGPTVGARRGNPTKVVKWLNTGTSITTTATYDETGQILTSVDGCGNANCSDMTGTAHTTTYAYTDNYVAGSGSPTGGATNAYLTSITSPLSLKTSYSYRYSDGQVASVTDPNNLTTNLAYVDSLNRLTQIQGPPDPNNSNQRPTTNYSYNDTAAASPTSLTPSVTTSEVLNSSTNKTTVAIFDGMGHTVHTELTSDPSGTDSVDTVYNGMGEVYSVSNPHRSGSSPSDGTTTYAYDALSRKTTQTNPDSSTQQWCYNGTVTNGQSICAANASTAPSGSWVDFADETGKHAQRASDSFGRLLAVMEPDPATGALALETDYTYDSLNDLLSVNQKGASGETPRTRSFTYDSLGRLITSTNPETGTICYGTISGGSCTEGYDANGNLATKSDARLLTVSYVYDALNRLTAKTASDNSFSYSYTYDQSSHGYGAGRLTSSSNNLNAGSSYSYDVMGRLYQKMVCVPSECNYSLGANASYDLGGDMVRSQFANAAEVTSVFDAASRPTSSTFVPVSGNSTTLLSGIVYGPVGPLQGTLGNGLKEVTAFDNRARLSSYSIATSGGTTKYSYGLTYLQNGDISAATDSVNGSWTYTYDMLNRVNKATGTSATAGWTYDSFGNRKTQSAVTGTVPTSTLTFTGTATNRADQFCYDASGNVLDEVPCSQVTVHNFAYDADGKLISSNQGVVKYVYDADGLRIAKQSNGTTSNEYFYDLVGNMTVELDGSQNVIRQELYSGGRHLATLTGSGTFSYAHTNWLGTESARSDGSGNVCFTATALPFGDNLNYSGSCNVSEKFFTGKERDAESGNDYFGARYYSSSMGRFMSPDWSATAEPVPYAVLGNPQSLNLYAYVHNNPLAQVDPDGHWATDDPVPPEGAKESYDLYQNGDQQKNEPKKPAQQQHPAPTPSSGSQIAPPPAVAGTLTINTNTATGSGPSSLLGNHAWLTFVTEDGTVYTYGTYGNGNGAQGVGGVNENSELNYPATASRSQHIDADHAAYLSRFIGDQIKRGSDAWSNSWPCSGFAATGWSAGTGEHLDPMRHGILNSPENLEGSINAANGTQ